MSEQTVADRANWYRSRSLWLDQLDPFSPRPALRGDVEADVAIVGGGLLGIWTAYYLAKRDPSLKIAVLEREIVGFGAAGRNGGWAGAGIAGSSKVFAKRGGPRAVQAGAQLVRDAVDEIGRVVAAEGIECDYVKGGTLTIAMTDPQLTRLRSEFSSSAAAALRGSEDRRLDADGVAEHLTVAGALGGAFTPHCARIQPARLVRGLADRAEHLGVTIYERTAATDVREGAVVTEHGNVRAQHVLLAVEAWLPQLPRHGSEFLPLSSMMIATEPLEEAVWDELGWAHGLTVRDKRHHFFYAQRTADDRIAIGGRGAPYRLGSPFREFDGLQDQVFGRLTETLHQHFPATRDAAVTHTWGGLLGVPRDWSMSVRYDPATRLGAAGGFSGHGVVAANIAGKTLADLVVGDRTEHTRMPWVGHRSPRWEPEPLRFLASNAIVRILMGADAYEDRTGCTAQRTSLVKPFLPPG